MKRPARLLLLLFALSMLHACTFDEDTDPISGDDRDKYAGSWLFYETPGKKSTSYTVTISNDQSNSVQVKLKNFGNVGYSYSAYAIATSTTLTVPEQELAPGLIISGSGSLTDVDEMVWNYSIYAGGDMENYEAVATR
jgi:hypothetical protein